MYDNELTLIIHYIHIYSYHAIHYILYCPSRTFPTRKLNKDDPNDMQWVYTKAVERGNKYNITGKAMFAIIIIMTLFISSSFRYVNTFIL